MAEIILERFATLLFYSTFSDAVLLNDGEVIRQLKKAISIKLGLKSAS